MRNRRPRFELFQDNQGEWRFRLRASNGEIICQSQGYSSKQAAKGGIEAVARCAFAAYVKDYVYEVEE